MAIILAVVLVYARLLGTERLDRMTAAAETVAVRRAAGALRAWASCAATR